MLTLLLLTRLVVTWPEGIEPNITCRAGDVAVMPTDGAFVWETSEPLQCDGPAIEPFDTPPSESPVTVRVRRARNVSVESPAPFTVEWRVDDGNATRLIARRSYRAGKTDLRVADETRLLRFMREDASPVTLVVTGGAKAVTLPPAKSGGEIYAVMDRKRFSPDAFQTTVNGKPFVAEVNDGRLIAAGLPAGRIALKSVYRGGIAGPSTTILVTEATTTEVMPWQLPAVGGVELRADPAFCESEHELVLSRAEPTAIVTRAPINEKCRWSFLGLEPGDYHAELLSPRRDAQARSELRIDADSIANSELHQFNVRVNGTVTYGEVTPATDVKLTFRPEAKATTFEGSAKTDSLGRFTIELPKPGDYTIAVHATEYLATAAGERRTFKAGEQDLHLALPESRLQVDVKFKDGRSLDDDELIQLSISSIHAVGPVFGRDLPLTVAAPFGEYRVSARADSATGQANVRLSKDEPAAKVTVELETAQGSLEVTGDGKRLDDARVIAGNRLLREISPGSGSFPLDGVPAGTMIMINRRGYLPTCVFRSPQHQMHVSLLPLSPFQTVIRLNPPQPGRQGYVRGLPGTACAVNVRDLPGDYIGGAIEIMGLPAGTYEYEMNRVRTPFTVPGPEVSVAVK